jgi:D-alanyl-D-alanine dipeptidase
MPDLVEVVELDSTIKLDIRYASPDNFAGQAVYDEARAFLHRPAAEALVDAHKELKYQGYGLIVFDGYRPWRVTKLFWDLTPPDERKFVADPEKGSRHNRGCAVDVTLYDLKSGKAVEMTSGYDEMNETSYPDYEGGTVAERRRRDLLIQTMENHGFIVYEYEWWHFDYKGWEEYKVLDTPFSEIE